MSYARKKLIDALVSEWEYLCHDDPDPSDASPEEYRKDLEGLTLEELIEETCTDESFTLKEYMEVYG